MILGPFKAKYKNRIPDPGVCNVISVNWETKRIVMSNGTYSYYPLFDEVDIVKDDEKNANMPDQSSWN